MTLSVLLPGITALLAFAFAAALLDQWLERRQTFQLVWAAGMLFFAIASGSETLAALNGWNEVLYKTWYLTGAVWAAGWLGLGTCYLLGRTRFGYVALAVPGRPFTFLAARRMTEPAGLAPILYFIAAGISPRPLRSRPTSRTSAGRRSRRLPWSEPPLRASCSMATVTVPPPGYALDPRTGMPVGTSSRQRCGC